MALPEECETGGRVGRLKRWLYGMRPAASAWDEDYSKRLAEAGYIKGKAATTAFKNPSTGGQCVVHGDDFTFVAEEADGRMV